jgi:hypothetical protein
LAGEAGVQPPFFGLVLTEGKNEKGRAKKEERRGKNEERKRTFERCLKIFFFLFSFFSFRSFSPVSVPLRGNEFESSFDDLDEDRVLTEAGFSPLAGK